MGPLSSQSAGKRLGLALGAVFVGLIAAILVCEALGWPFLVGPLQHKLASALDRKIDFGSDTQGVQIRLC
jgi:AsmA family protein